MAYEITIVRRDRVERTTQEWQRVSDSGNGRDSGPVYEYVPCTATRIEESRVLVQEVDDLDVAAVIRAINKL